MSGSKAVKEGTGSWGMGEMETLMLIKPATGTGSGTGRTVHTNSTQQAHCKPMP